MASEKLDKNTLEIAKRVKLLKAINNEVNYDLVAEKLPEMLADGSLVLDTSLYKPSNPETKTGVGRYLVYEHIESGNQFSIWAFAFAPQQKTSIHDHKCRGTVTVIEGVLSEKFYTTGEDKTAEIKTRCDRYKFHTNEDDNTDEPPVVHQLKYRKGMAKPDTVAVSLHIYDMPAYQVESNDYNRNLLNIFQKKHSSSVKPAYETLTVGFHLK